jgi:hypothetical protein
MILYLDFLFCLTFQVQRGQCSSESISRARFVATRAIDLKSVHI